MINAPLLLYQVIKIYDINLWCLAVCLYQWVYMVRVTNFSPIKQLIEFTVCSIPIKASKGLVMPKIKLTVYLANTALCPISSLSFNYDNLSLSLGTSIHWKWAASLPAPKRLKWWGYCTHHKRILATHVGETKRSLTCEGWVEVRAGDGVKH